MSSVKTPGTSLLGSARTPFPVKELGPPWYFSTTVVLEPLQLTTRKAISSFSSIRFLVTRSL